MRRIHLSMVSLHDTDNQWRLPMEAELLLLTATEAARRLSMSRAWIYPLLMSGEIRSVLIGRSRRVPAIELQRWLDRQLNENAPAGRSSL